MGGAELSLSFQRPFQCFSVSVFQCFSVSVFRCFGERKDPSLRTEPFSLLLLTHRNTGPKATETPDDLSF